MGLTQELFGINNYITPTLVGVIRILSHSNETSTLGTYIHTRRGGGANKFYRIYTTHYCFLQIYILYILSLNINHVE